MATFQKNTADALALSLIQAGHWFLLLCFAYFYQVSLGIHANILYLI